MKSHGLTEATVRPADADGLLAPAIRRVDRPPAPLNPSAASTATIVCVPAFSRLRVRRLMTMLRIALGRQARPPVFEPTRGRLVAEVGVAPLRPPEYPVVRIFHDAAVSVASSPVRARPGRPSPCQGRS
ncbi:putative protein OS=Streptomyces canus OX=58343 GN=AQI96_28310 PE=4 SV=1 [Streptomyces canus]